MKNSKVKQMITNEVLKGRKLFWFGEETEIFVAKSLQQLADEFGWPEEDEPVSEQGGEIPLSWLWKLGYDEEGTTTRAINWVYGDAGSVCQLSSSYN